MYTKKMNPFWDWHCIASKKMFLLLLCSLCFWMQLLAQSKETRFTITVKKASINVVFDKIEAQSNYRFFYLQSVINRGKPVSIELKNAPIKTVLEGAFQDQPFDYKIDNNSILVIPKADPKPIMLSDTMQTISGRVVAKDGAPLSGANIKVLGGRITAFSDANGNFSISAYNGSILEFSYIGFESKQTTINKNIKSVFQIELERLDKVLEEVSVVSTGYQKVNVNQTTGAFTQVDNELLNRRVATDVLSKLDGAANGLYFNGTGNMLTANYTLPNPSVNLSNKLGINIRGQSTLNNNVSKDPLIVIDNFPYEGDINNINPDLIESVTVLKDAAAASIWGARAGNGVIVLTTKKGRYNQRMKLNFTTNFTIGDKPDVYSDRGFLNAKSFIALEDSLYVRGNLNADINNNILYSVVSPVIDIREKIRKGMLTSTEGEAMIENLRKQDVRKDILKYIYQPALNQQYALSVRGGSDNINYALNFGYDNNDTYLRGNGYKRITASSLNNFKPIKNLEITGAVMYSQIDMKSNNSFNWGNTSYNMGGTAYTGMYPYMQLADANGNPLPVARRYRSSYIDSTQNVGFLDWNYFPLKEIDNADNRMQQRSLLFKVSVKYNILSYLTAELLYQNERQDQLITNHFGLGTYFTNNLINQFTQFNPTTKIFNYPIPNNGGIINLNNGNSISNNWRGQLNYNSKYKKHNVNALAGADVREVNGSNYIRTSYGYDAVYGTSINNLDFRTIYSINASNSGMQIPASSGEVRGTLNRFISYYANGNYIYNDRYMASFSARKDGANIFGVKTNQKVVPLWSAGLGWEINKEAFYRSNKISYLKIRATYGFNGNIFNGTSFTVGYYQSGMLTPLQYLTALTAPNPKLRWEKVKNTNLGIDFALKNGLVTGSLDYFIKNGLDLIDSGPLAASTGFTGLTGNMASTRTKGLELVLNGNIFAKKQLNWRPAIILNLLKDKVTKSYAKQSGSSINDPGTVWEGYSIYSVFGYKWEGLDEQTGDPKGWLNGKMSKDYASIIANYNPDSLIYKGSGRPTIMASFRNELVYKNFSLSINLVYKGGYYFRRTSTTLNYTDILKGGMHQDFDSRWQLPGDELYTSVPSLTYTVNNNRNTFYRYSEQLISKADHLRLQDIRIAYRFTKGRLMNATQLYVYINNLGILWRANKYHLDPMALGTTLPTPKSISFGLSKNF